MKTYNFAQGSPDWHKHRNWLLSGFFSASDAPAMKGCKGAHSTRDQLLRVYKYQIPKEVSEYLQRKFDDGHLFEALARPIAETIMGEDLYPVIGSNGNLSASFDGLARSNRGWEHKSINNAIRDAFALSTDILFDDGTSVVDLAGFELTEKYTVQMEHQMLVSGGKETLFSATKWSNEECEEQLHCWYQSNPELAESIVAGWHQFKLDLDAMPELEVIKDTQMAVIGRAPAALPVLRIKLAGMVALTEDNLAEYSRQLDLILAKNSVKPVTDQDFADAEQEIKYCEQGEADLENAETQLLNDTGSVAEAIRIMRAMGEKLRAHRLAKQKYVAANKVTIRSEIVNAGIRAFSEFMTDLFDPCVSNWPLSRRFRLPELPSDFQGCIANLRTVTTMQNAVNTELAQAKIVARAVFEVVDANIGTAVVLNRHDLWPDLNDLVKKPTEDFSAVLKARIAEADKAEADRVTAKAKADAERIAQEAKDAADKAAADKLNVEAQARAIKQRDEEAERKRLEASHEVSVAVAPTMPMLSTKQLRSPISASFDPFAGERIPEIEHSDRCPHCDDTGDVTALDGEWRGICSCPAGDLIRKVDPPSVITITSAPVLATPENTINIGQIIKRLDVGEGLKVNRVFLEKLGFEGVLVGKGGSLHKYLDTDFPNIVVALIAHLQTVK